MTTATREMIARPLLGQLDLRCIHEAAARIRNLHGAAPYLPRNLNRGELQLLALCDAICGLVVGELGEDGLGDPVGDLVLREVPGLSVAHQLKLRPTENNGA